MYVAARGCAPRKDTRRQPILGREGGDPLRRPRCVPRRGVRRNAQPYSPIGVRIAVSACEYRDRCHIVAKGRWQRTCCFDAGVPKEIMAISEKKATALRAESASERMTDLQRQYGCGPVELAGGPHALYDRHLFFDNVSDAAAASPRQRFEAFARSVRDVLSQRWVRTEQTYERREPQARLLPVDGVPDRALTRQQHDEPDAQSPRERSRQAEVPRLALLARRGTRRRARKRRARASGGVLPRFDGHYGVAGGRVRPSVRVRNVQAIHCEWLATGAAGQLASSARSVGSDASR